MDSMLCRFKATYPAERIDSVRSLLEDKERQMFLSGTLDYEKVLSRSNRFHCNSRLLHSKPSCQ